MRCRMRVVLATTWISVAGCAGHKDSVLPPDGDTMQTIYDRHFSDIGMRDTVSVRDELKNRPLDNDIGDLAGYVREAYNELDVHFPRLPNPALVMYVFPHLAGEARVPVPGYATTFPLYERVEYALPGEAPVRPPGSVD